MASIIVNEDTHLGLKKSLVSPSSYLDGGTQSQKGLPRESRKQPKPKLDFVFGQAIFHHSTYTVMRNSSKPTMLYVIPPDSSVSIPFDSDEEAVQWMEQDAYEIWQLRHRMIDVIELVAATRVLRPGQSRAG